VARLLNQFTYFEMKKRAGVVGGGLARDLDKDGLGNVALHLIGHSFGARLVTSAASRLKTIRPASMTLLQAAYSQNGLGIGKLPVPEGAFRNVIAGKRVSGPIVITHTRNDKAVGIAYVIASRASGVTAAAFGGPTDPFGGMGANGAQLVAAGEAVPLAMVSGAVPGLTSGVINNVLADAVIADHGDVTNPTVARLVLAAVRAAGA
jgi:pimeloyl-ACP methyl ester carboxylesterase